MAGNRILFFPVTAYHARLRFRENMLGLIAGNIKALFGE